MVRRTAVKAKFPRSSRPQTGIRSPPISGPRPSFLPRSRCGSRSPASAGPIPVRTLSRSCADAERVDPELGGSCGDASVLLAAGEDICGVVAPRRCLGPTRCWRNIYLWCLKYLWCLLFVDSRVPLGLLDQHGIAFFGPCLPARSDCCLLELG